MKFYSKEPALQVLITESKYCAFKNHLYETEDADEIEILSRAKGIKHAQKDEKQKDASQSQTSENLKLSEKPENRELIIEDSKVTRKNNEKILKARNFGHQRSKKRKPKAK